MPITKHKTIKPYIVHGHTPIISVSALLVLTLVVSLTVFFSQKQQNIQQHAAGGTKQQNIQQHAAGGTNLYVATSGSDSNNGSQSSPFATITKADSMATPGTIIHVASGTYSWPGITVSHSGTAAAPITYISDVKFGAKFIPSSVGSSTGNFAWILNGSYIRIVGFEIDGHLTGSGGGIGIKKGPFDQVIGNKIHDFQDSGLYTYFADGAHDVDVIGNIVYNIGPTGANSLIHGIYTTITGGHISNNIVYGVAGYGIHCWHACTGEIITNNLAFNNRTGGIIVGAGDNPGGVVMDNMVVNNNIAYNNAGHGIREYENSGTSTIGSHNQFMNNITYGNPTNMHLIEGNTDQGTIVADPQSVNYQANGSGDYHLKAGSPAIDAGIATGAPATDIDGNPRPQGKGFDIGPYEYVQGATTFPTLTIQPTTPTTIIPTSPTITGVNTTFALTVCPHGLGNCGDNANPNSTGNTAPKHQQRVLTYVISNIDRDSFRKTQLA